MGKNKKVNNKVKDFFSSTLFLKIVFIALLIIIIGLAVLIYQKEEKDKKVENVHITVPVNQSGTDFEFGIDALLLSKENNKEYTIKITNYKDDNINDEEMPYQILIENPTDCVISVKKGKDEQNLMKSQESTLIEGEVLKSKEKEDVYYHIFIDSIGKLENNELLHVKVTS